MDLQDYPRPANDTGIGLHWSTGSAAAVGMRDMRNYWVPELQALGVKWVKLLHDGGLELAELLLQNDIMPVVRLYRPRPNSTDPSPGKGTLGRREIEFLERYVAVGVRYFEFNNEPEVHGEWEGGQVPPTAETIVARHAIIDMETILERGGYPGVPATAVGTKWDLVGKIVQLGRRDLFEEPVWVAVHNYDLNHPLDYPYDAVNQEARQLTRAEYDHFDRQGAWYGTHWGYRSMEWVNEQRRLGVNEGDTVLDDPSCWLAYKRVDQLVREHLDRPLPILSTENGPLVGEDDDPRYPTTTTERHRDKVLDIARIMMGTSAAYEAAPPQYFCSAFWLVGASLLFGTWESHAWYSPTRPGGTLPAVPALKALEKRTRTGPGPIWSEGVIQGWIRNGSGHSLLVDGPVSRVIAIGPDETFRLEGLPAGRYTVQLQGTELRRELTLAQEQPPLVLDLELTPDLLEPPSESVLHGHIVGGAGYVVVLSGAAHRRVIIDQRETYRFEALPRGEYTLTLQGTAVGASGIVLDGQEERQVNLELETGWVWDEWDGGPGPGFGVVRCSVEGLAGLPVHLWSDGWPGIMQRTGSKPEYGAYACEFAPLGGGRYYLKPEGLDVQADVSVDGRHIVWVAFREQAAPPDISGPQESVVSGRVLGGARYIAELRSDVPLRREAVVSADGYYRFEALPAGTYRLQLLRVTEQADAAGEPRQSRSAIAGQVVECLELDGENEVSVDFDVRILDPLRGDSVLHGRLVEGAGQTVALRWPGGFSSETWVEEDGAFYFQGLAAGKYELQVKSTSLVRTIQSDGEQDVTIDLWMPDLYTGVIWGRVPGGSGHQIVLEWTAGRQETSVASNSIYRFDGLPSGSYDLYLLDMPTVREAIELGKDETLQINLQVPPPKAIDHYVLLRKMLADWKVFLAAMRYAARFGPALGDDVDAARQAHHVTIIGDEDAVSPEDLEDLRRSGCDVQRIASDIAAELARRIAEGTAY